MSVKLLTKHHLEFLSLKGDCTGSSESTLVKMPHCWKSHVVAHMFLQTNKKITHMNILYHCQSYDISWNKIKICTVKPVLSGHSKTDKTKILMTNGSLMKVINIAECPPWSILQYF